MKAIKYILVLCITAVTFSACNDDFMNKYPETSISAENFFTTVSDLEIYTNKIYNDILSVPTDDVFSDNISLYTGTSTTNSLLRGNIDDKTIGGWSKDKVWNKLRSINFMLVNTNNVAGSPEDVNHYIGIARLFRAIFYYNMVKDYSDVPWYSTPLNSSDTELLMKARDPRVLVVDSIMNDLQFAVEHIKILPSRTRINKYAALQELARIALTEGAFRKYHNELNLESTANSFFEIAISSTNTIINSGEFEITGNGAIGYQNLFVSGDLSANKEMLLYRDFDKGLNVGNNSHTVLDWQWSLSKSLADSYLTTNGTPATADPQYFTKGYIDMFNNRDPRMAETIIPPGLIFSGNSTPHFAKVTFGGLPQVKFYPRDIELRQGWGLNYTDLPIYRYGETLLIYAEAKAELGIITSEDLDKSINKLRARVGMPNLSMSVALDPYIAAQYPNVSGTQTALILEIRRERRVELACEGQRYTDVKRWAVGALLEKPFEGYYVPALGALDISGDSEPDIAILNSPTDLGPISGLTEEQKGKLVYYYLHDENGTKDSYYLSEGDKGNIRFRVDIDNPKKFISPQYYYWPLPFDQVRDNPNLEQLFGW